ncbi:hypothetical protein [Tenacibaculum dicentrarchi]|uniref:hypothetical protein n=2 Tax=Tenacibaculum dicentrarchi TaxID=669041 RepID=UPI000C7CD8E4|nr:putative Uncharacterised protein [Tenacibaculum dicentrarchi]
MENTMENTRTKKLKNTVDFMNKIGEKRKCHLEKSKRARKSENRDLHIERYHHYSLIFNRASSLKDAIVSDSKFGTGRRWHEMNAEQWKEYILLKKEDKKQKFDNNYRVFPYFDQASLSADYGVFICDCCGTKFYHSPSDVYLGKEKISSSSCGNCANRKLKSNNQESIFH